MTDIENEFAEGPVSGDAFEGNPVLQQYQTEDEQEHWLAELDAARKERRAFHESGLKTIKRYADERDASEQGRAAYNLFFANTEIKSAALFAKAPKPDIKRRFDDADDDPSRVAGNILQRDIVIELDQDGFVQTMKQILFDRLVPGMGVGWVRLEQETGDDSVDPLTGMPVPGQVTDEFAPIDHVAWNDFWWAPCRTWRECQWVGRRVPMSKDAIKDRFADTAPAAVLRNLTFSTPSPTKADSKDSLAPKHGTEATIDVYELWDKSRKLIFWITEHADVPLDVQQDTNEFPDFFPTPLPPLGRFTTSNTNPISDFSLVRSQYNELDELNAKAANLTKAIQVRWVYDSANGPLKDLYSTAGNLEGIPVKDWSVMQSEKGGLRGAIEFAPLAEIVQAYQTTIQCRETVKAQINEIEGIGDALRGVSDRYVSAAATNEASQLGTTRISIAQREVADYIARLLKLKAHLMCKFYAPTTLVTRAGQLAEADLQLVGPALQLLKNEQLNHFRLDVSVDSLQLENWNQEKAERTQLIGAIGQFLGQVAPAMQHAGLAPLGPALLKFAVTGYKGSKDIEGEIDKVVRDVQQQAEQQKANPQPKPPSPEEVKAQVAQARIQADMQIAQMEAQTAQAIAQLKAQTDQQALQIKQMLATLEAQKVQLQAAHNQARLQLETHGQAHTHAQDLVLMGQPTGAA